jgi:anti-sigma regulatory factor (Ser/Thr protein kinase)
MGFDRADCSKIGLGVMEISQNILDHATAGMVHIDSLNEGRILRIELSDEGNGIPDINKIFQDGYSSSQTSLGIGMGVAKRSFDQCIVKSIPNQGTHVTLEKYLPLDKNHIQYGSVSVKDERYLVNGDKIFTKAYDGDSLLIAMIDGAGQGQSAADISECISSVISKTYRDDLVQLIYACDEALSVSDFEGGAAMTLIRFMPSSLSILGVGDTHTYIARPHKLQPIGHIYGRIGVDNLPSLNAKSITYNDDFSLVCCTDGIKTDAEQYIIDRFSSPRNNAAHIFNTYHRPYGDASVFVLNYRKHAKG